MQFLKPALKQYIWGGQRLCRLFETEAQSVAEAWVLSAHENGPSVDCDTGKAFAPTQAQICATGASGPFPILIKFIDARDKLSLQVHPDDSERCCGKTEMWIVLDAQEGAKLAYGFKDTYAKEDVARAIESNEVEDMVNFVEVKRGDVVFVPAGTLHGIGAGLLILEIQQNSDTTYRVYDYGRLQNGKPRQLHVDEALGCMQMRPCAEKIANFADTHTNVVQKLVECGKFRVEKLSLDGELEVSVEKTSFKSFVVTDGEITIGSRQCRPGCSVFAPCGLGPVQLRGKGQVVISSVPEQ